MTPVSGWLVVVGIPFIIYVLVMLKISRQGNRRQKEKEERFETLLAELKRVRDVLKKNIS